MKHFNYTFLLALLMSMVETKVSAHDIEVANADGVTIYYQWTNNKIELAVSYRGSSRSSYSNEYSGNVSIPQSVTYGGNTYPVTSIGAAAFSGCNGLTSVTIPSSVTSIFLSAFEGCSGLTSVTIPSSVTGIDEEVFHNCSSLTSVTIQEGVTSIGAAAFSGCNGLTSVTIPSSVTNICSYAFGGCSGLTSVVVEAGNSKYDSRNSCNAIIETESNTLIFGCKNTIIPSSVTNIGPYAFSGCSGLTSVTIPSSVTSIGYEAFNDCSGLTSVTIPSSVTSIGNYAFSGTAWFNNQSDGLVYAGKVAYKYKGTMPDGTNIVLNEGTIGIANGAFSGCSGLTSVTIPSSVTAIGSSAFADCI